MVTPIRFQNIKVQSINTPIRVQNIELQSFTYPLLPSDSRISRNSHSVSYPVRRSAFGALSHPSESRISGIVIQFPIQSDGPLLVVGHTPVRVQNIQEYSLSVDPKQRLQSPEHDHTHRSPEYEGTVIRRLHSETVVLRIIVTLIRVQNKEVQSFALLE